MAQGSESSSLEDYLRTLYRLADAEGRVHAVDVARALKVSKPSVHRAMSLLADAGYVVADPYSPIVLTETGKSQGQALERRYETIFHFLVSELGVAEDVAAEEAHGLEHALSKDTAERMRARFGTGQDA